MLLPFGTYVLVRVPLMIDAGRRMSGPKVKMNPESDMASHIPRSPLPNTQWNTAPRQGTGLGYGKRERVRASCGIGSRLDKLPFHC